MDGGGHAYSATLLGTSLSWNGSTFTLGAAGTSDAVSSTTIALPAGNDSTVNLLATAVNGNQPNQTFVVTYTDGTTSSFTQSLSDWFTPQNYAGESQALAMPYRLVPSGATDNGPFYLYGYSFAINSAKTVKSITLPNNRNVVVLAVDLTPATGGTPPAASPTIEPAPATYTSAQSGHALRHHAGCGDLLHHQRHDADHEFCPVQPGHAAADQRNDHRRGHRGRQRLQQ